MKANACYGLILAVLLMPVAAAAETQTKIDLRQGVPQDAHLAVYGKDNPERAYQKKHLAAVCETFREERIVERFLDIVTGQMADQDVEQARSVWDEIQTALEPMTRIDFLNAEEIVYAQAMEQIFNHHLVLIRLTPADATEFQRGSEQLFELFETWSEGEVGKRTYSSDGGEYTVLELPPDAPFRPTLVRVDDVVVFSTSENLATNSAKQLLNPAAISKFDDPRFAEGWSQLPEAEDAIIIFDGQLMFSKLRGIGDFIRAMKPNSNEEMERWLGVLDRIIDEVAILDYELTVEYTEGQQNRIATFGKVVPDAKEKLLYQAVTQGKPFENWQSWVPADAEAYSLHTGFNLHVVYEGVMKYVRDEFPEAQNALDSWEAKQEEIGFHVDRDLLQVFSGETVSVTVPVEDARGKSTQSSVTAMRCHDEEKIRGLIQRGMAALAALPPVQAQQLKLVDCEDLEGFQEVHATMLDMFGVRPVIGFHDGWMMFSGSPEAIGKVIATRQGEAESINQAESFQKFNLEVTGPVVSISYTDVSAAVHQAADTIEQIGAIAPMFIGMMAAQTDPEDLKPVQEIVGLLPSLAKVVRKFDFVEEQLTVTRGDEEGQTYRRDGVWIIRPVDKVVGE